jgi:hypothetical protein
MGSAQRWLLKEQGIVGGSSECRQSENGDRQAHGFLILP